MKTYELTYIVSPEVTSEEAEGKAKEIESLINKNGGTILMQSNPVAKTFSYPIKKSASGFLGSIEFQVEPENLLKLQETLSKDEKIIRQMLTIKETEKIKKERRSKPAMVLENKKEEVKEIKKEDKEKVELKDIEQTLDEILNE